ncbi:MAG: hypothetical protein IT434_15555 [Phycisphaerales bacterium]|nr:hypothetical protein [Phycisphaerales bacterium]
MPIRIRFNAQQVQLVPWPPRRGEGPSWLNDKSALRSALREAVAEEQGATQLREMLVDVGARGVHRASDDELIELAVELIEQGRLMILPPEWRWRPKLMASATSQAQAQEVAPAARTPVTKTWFAVKIVDEKTGEPVSSVRLKITLPDGVEDYYTTSAGGSVRIDDIPPGTCDIACDLTGATMDDTYEFKGEGQPPPPAPNAKVWPSRKISASNLKRIAEIERHKVKDGESILSLATAAGFDWKFLARFNWGTDVPTEINKHLVNDNGIWKKTKDGKNYSFTSTDHPGIMFIPKKWEKLGVATGTEHVFKVRHIVPYIIRLETLSGHRIPDAKYKITWANKDTKEGQLGPQGIDMIEDPPPGAFQIEYLDLHEVLAKGLAAEARAAMDKGTQEELLHLLKYDAETTTNMVTYYDKYFNNYSGKGLIEDLYKKFPDEDERGVLEILLASNDQTTKSNLTSVDPPIYEPIEMEVDEKFGKVGALQPEGGSGGR